MEAQVGPRIFFVDDDSAILRSVSRTLESLPAEVHCFCGTTECLGRVGDCDLLITDVKMPGMDGLELLTRAKRMRPSLPVIVVTGYGDIPMAVRAMRVGASEFIEKPLRRDKLLSAVRSALKQALAADPPEAAPKLTGAEMQVLNLVLEGKSNKEIAVELHRSIRTVEDHRGHIMHKWGINNLIDLIKKAASTGLFELPESP